MEKIKRKLKFYFILTSTTSFLIYTSIFLNHKYGTSVTMEGITLRKTGLIFFVLAVASGIAVPILLRAFLQKRMIEEKSISMGEYLNHNMRLAVLTICTVIFSGVNYVIAAPELYLYGSVFAALYSIYAIMPAEKRIITEIKYYRIEAGD